VLWRWTTAGQGCIRAAGGTERALVIAACDASAAVARVEQVDGWLDAGQWQRGAWASSGAAARRHPPMMRARRWRGGASG